MSNKLVSIVSSNKEHLAFLAMTIEKRGFDVKTYDDILVFLEKQSAPRPWAAVIDLLCLKELKDEIRSHLFNFEGCIPTLRATVNLSNKEISGIFSDDFIPKHLILETFFNEHCKAFQRKAPRKELRAEVSLQVILSKEHQQDSPTRVSGNTINISSSGLFVKDYHDAKPGDSIYVRLSDLHKSSYAMKARVCWVSPLKNKTNIEYAGTGLQLLTFDSSYLKFVKKFCMKK